MGQDLEDAGRPIKAPTLVPLIASPGCLAIIPQAEQRDLATCRPQGSSGPLSTGWRGSGWENCKYATPLRLHSFTKPLQIFGRTGCQQAYVLC